MIPLFVFDEYTLLNFVTIIFRLIRNNGFLNCTKDNGDLLVCGKQSDLSYEFVHDNNNCNF